MSIFLKDLIRTVNQTGNDFNKIDINMNGLFKNFSVLKNNKIYTDDINNFQLDQKDFFIANGNLIKNILTNYKGKQIGQGGVGKIFSLKSPYNNIIIKTNSPCFKRNLKDPNIPENAVDFVLCDQAENNNKILVIPGGKNNIINILYPNILLEIEVGWLLSNYILYSNICPFFPSVIGGGMDLIDKDKPTYTIMEKLETITDSSSNSYVINSLSNLYYTLFGIFYALNIAQEKFNFMHGDLHLGNIMIKKTPPVVSSYPVKKFSKKYDKRIYILQDFYPVIIDFGFSQIKLNDPDITGNTSFNLSPRFTWELPGGSVTNFGYFNPYSDGLSLYGSISVFGRGNNPISLTPNNGTFINQIAPGIWTQQVDEQILSILTGIDINDKNLLLDTKRKIFDWHVWRPNINNINILSKNIEFKTPLEVSEKFLELFIDSLPSNNKTNISLDTLRDINNFFYRSNSIKTCYGSITPPIGLNKNYIHYNMKANNKVIQPIINIPRYIISVNYDLDAIGELSWLKVESWSSTSASSKLANLISLNEVLQPYNLTPSPDQLKNCNSQSQIVHIAYINTLEAYENGYVAKNDCCKLNLFDYLSQFNSGFVINTTFFDIKEKKSGRSYKPIGIFKNSYYEKNIDDTPLYYRDHDKTNYPVITIGDDGKFEIKNIKSNFNFNNYPQLFTAGPLLIYKEKVVMDKNKLNEISLFTPKPDDTISRGIISDNLYQSEKYKNNDITANSGKKILKKYRKVYKNNQGICETKSIKNTSYVSNVDKIEPAELSHAANANPRSAFIIRTAEAQKDGKGDIAFVFVEGRIPSGIGMDLVQLTELCQKLGAYSAVNLDGGGSSNFAWKFEDSDVINIPSYYRNIYPLGGVLGFVKN